MNKGSKDLGWPERGAAMSEAFIKTSLLLSQSTNQEASITQQSESEITWQCKI